MTVIDGSGAVLQVGDLRVTLPSGETIRLTLVPGADKMQLQLAGPASANEVPSVASEVRVLSSGSAIELALPGKLRRRFRGDLFILPASSRNSLRIILQVGLESAVASVVAAELTGIRSGEALEAMAIVARTYMLSHLARHKTDGFDFCDTTHCQFYRGEDDWMEGQPPPAVASAVAETRGEWIGHRGSLVETYYTAACGGITYSPRAVWGGRSKSSFRYANVACEWCRESPYWRWERSSDAALVFDGLSSVAGFRISDNAELIARTRNSTGLVRAVVVRDGRRTLAINVEAFRRALGKRLGWNTVRSPSFVIERQGSRFVFRGKGFGSQVGLCVAGAIAQAAAGRTHSQILGYYFPGTVIVTP